MSALSEPPEGPATVGDDWMQVRIVAPPEVGAGVLALLRDWFDFRDTDWCVMERREDYSRIDYDPCSPRTQADHGREYTIDWRQAN